MSLSAKIYNFCESCILFPPLLIAYSSLLRASLRVKSFFWISNIYYIVMWSLSFFYFFSLFFYFYIINFFPLWPLAYYLFLFYLAESSLDLVVNKFGRDFGLLDFNPSYFSGLFFLVTDIFIYGFFFVIPFPLDFLSFFTLFFLLISISFLSKFIF